MTYVERDITIGAAPDVVFGYAAVAENLPQWYVGVAGVQSDGVWPQPGGQIAVNYQAAGMNFDVTLTALTYNPSDEFSFQLDGMVAGTSTWRYTPSGGGTHLVVGFDYDLPGGVLGQIADRLVVEQMYISNGEQTLANLKAICEGG
jgi:uncharacterized membrane protein